MNINLDDKLVKELDSVFDNERKTQVEWDVCIEDIVEDGSECNKHDIKFITKVAMKYCFANFANSKFSAIIICCQRQEIQTYRADLSYYNN